MAEPTFATVTGRFDRYAYPDDEHHAGEHVDIDPFIPTGICALCADIPQETEPPEDRAEAN